MAAFDTPARWEVIRRLSGDGHVFRLGTVTRKADGYRFWPAVAHHRPSRKAHPTFEACLPRWVGYPDRCETRGLG